MRFALCLLVSLMIHLPLAWLIWGRAVSRPAVLERAHVELSIAPKEAEDSPPDVLPDVGAPAHAPRIAESQLPPEALEPTEIALAPDFPAPTPSFEPPEPSVEVFEVKEELSAPNRAALEGARAKTRITPKYPRSSRKNGEEGDVLLRLEIDVAGVVRAAAVIDSSGFPELDLAAERAALGARFDPALEDGKPIPSILQFKFAFRLK